VEGKLADTASNRPLALTIGAAAVTLVLILGVLVGPTVATCFNSTEGMGQCLRLRMTDAGLIPRPPATAVAQNETPAEPEIAANVAEPPVEAPAEAELEPVTSTPDLDVSEPEQPASDDVVDATFGLLRAEPDGSVVIAGSGEPGTDVEIFANGERLGSALVEPSGDWVFVPDAPLPPGGLEITLGEAGQPGSSAQSMIVVIDEDGVSQPLVVASAPGEASEVLQGLTEPQTLAEADLPGLSEPTAAEPPAEEPPVAEQPGAASPRPDVTPVDDASSSPDNSGAATEEIATSAPAAPAPEPSEQTSLPAEQNPPVREDISAPVEPAPDTRLTEEATETPQAADEPEPVLAEAPAMQSAPPTIDAIERDGDRTFFAGAGPEDGTVRLYVDDQFVADATVEDGRWLVEAGPVLDEDEQRVRADLLQDGSAEVAARAEVDFVVELPVEGEPVAVADNTDELPLDTSNATAMETEPVAPAVVESPETSPAPSVAAGPRPATESLPAQEESPPVAGSAPEATPQADVPRMVAVSLGDPEAERFASGRAIIRRGDNLWTIARRVYGEGIRYTTIYDANTAQISDPDRIYPGQVFDLPN
jgi:nucleoid-associated protein YgaU